VLTICCVCFGMKVSVLAGLSRSLLNFRGPLLRALRDRGHEVIAAAPEDDGSEAVREVLAAQGIRFEAVPLARGGLNPVQDFGSLRALQAQLRRHCPDVLFAYTAKPVIYGGLAARRVGGVRFFPMITGLGYAFTEGGGAKRRVVRAVVEALYRRALAGADAVIFQNPDDERLFRDLGLVPERVPSVRVYGSGVDLEAFAPSPLPTTPVFLMLARLVADKGVREYVEAARIVKQRFPDAVFQLAGGLDPNPAGVKAAEVQAWTEAGIVDYLGPVHPVQPLLAACRFYVLPSYYREGTPRSVLEALATGRPIITTDAPGCRETVVHGENGLLVPPRNGPALAEAMIQLLEAPAAEVERMAQASLALARDKYDVHKVNAQLLEVMGL
jgi:glycosyltransferase involved in cell wall biosynthesis